MLGFGKLRRLRGKTHANKGGSLLGLSAAAPSGDHPVHTNGGPRPDEGRTRNGLPAPKPLLGRGFVLDRMVPVSELISLEPRLDRAPLKPPTFTNFKTPETQAYLRLTAPIAPIATW